ncbi:cell adhesion molecule CEACAM1-like [Pelodytes ibericus]
MGSYGNIPFILLLLFVYGGEGREVTSIDTGNFLTGQNVTLSISYSGSGASVDWSINGTLVLRWQNGKTSQTSSKYNGRLFNTANGSLLLINTTVNDTGTYSVSVQEIDESPGSLSFHVRFYEPVVISMVESSPTSVSESTPAVNVTCRASSGAVTFTWEKDDLALGSNLNYSLLDGNRTLQLNNPNRSYSGNYTCIASNPVDSDQRTLNLSVSWVTDSSLSPGAIAGIVIGSVLGALLLIALIVLIVLCVRQRKGKSKKAAAGSKHKDVLRTVSGTTLSPDDPAFFTVNNIMYRNSSISMGSYIMVSGEADWLFLRTA